MLPAVESATIGFPVDCLMAAAGFVDICEKWETIEATKFVLHDIECVLRVA